MFLPENPSRRILLGIAGRDEADRYHLGTVEGVTAARPTGIAYRQGFETADHGWSIASRIEAALDTETIHDGKSSLRLRGIQQGAWNYTAHHLASGVLPGSKYRLSCWLKVDEIEPAGMAPYLKIGLTDHEGRLLENR